MFWDLGGRLGLDDDWAGKLMTMYVVAASGAGLICDERVPAGSCHGYRFGDRYTLCRVIHLSQLETFPLLPFPPPPETDVETCNDCRRWAEA